MSILRFLTVLILFSSAVCRPGSAMADIPSADNLSYNIVHDFRNDWLVYSENYQNYIPYTQFLHENIPSVSLRTDLLNNRHYKLLLNVSRETYLFIDGKLQKRISPDAWEVISIDSLYRTFRRNEVMITLYGNAGGITGKTAVLAFPKKLETAAAEAAPSNVIRLKPKPVSRLSDFLILTVIFIILVNAINFNLAPAVYMHNINPISLLEKGLKSNSLNKPFEYTNFLLAVQYSLVASFLIIFLINQGMTSPLSFLSRNGSLGELTLDYMQLVVTTFFVLHLKYILMFITGNVLNLKEIIAAHYLKILQSGSTYFALLCLLALILFSVAPEYFLFFRENLGFAISIFFLLRFFVLYIALLHKGTFINPYLFSYLCVTEVIPLIIGVKIARF